MGIYDREYYRGEGGGSGWFGGVSPWCNTLIVINCAVFLLTQSLNQESDFVRHWLMATPEGIFHQGKVWELWTATFLHGNIWHLVFNMLFLWFVGREMESLLGGRDFLAFYLASAGVSTLAWAAIHELGPLGGRSVPMLGASGAVTAVVTLFTLYYPRREILLFFILPMPMWVALAIYLFFPLFQPSRDVAYESHLAGAAFAFAFKQFDLRWSRLVGGRFRRPRLRIVKPVPVEQPRSRPSGVTRSSGEGHMPRPSSAAVITEEQLDARLDEVLAKIAREGRSGLTEEENRILQEASRRARSKRSDRL
ncbi:Rhomboid protease GluP [Aquisphaera giovannonii]|uniref:Rhomboid protease GluP n=1 Tax=Aquisphaera giovannonii TaxID=406548 RepID=A0A5B9W239_9BACT|nr:rhomboid family intramembrane serine protease [Aquisphaera giovannonii]QEH34329.1 Rhomboid protease GluP [Aquisphaera giovannonii]